MTAKSYAALLVAVAGAWIGWTLGATVASGMSAPVDSFWARAQLAGVLLQFGGMAVGAVLGYFLARTVLGD